jgi:transposase-like protein
MEKKSTPQTVRSTKGYEDLEAWARSRVQVWLQELLEDEVTAFLGRGKSERKLERRGYRNGHGKPRRFAMLNGTVQVRRPRVRNTQERFESQVLPYFRRKSKKLGELLPELYLHGLATGDFELAMRGLLGSGAPLSRASIQRMKSSWQLEYEEWKQQDLSGLEIVYQWADGLYVKAGIAKDRAALLVIIGALSDGRKVLLACESGQRESKESWGCILRDLKARGLKLGDLTVADGHLGIWAALAEQHPQGREQRCWNHKTVNVLDHLPKSEQSAAKQLLHEIAFAETRAKAERRRDRFVARYQDLYPKAGATLLRDWDRMVTFYDFPKQHWVHLRTTNVVESPFDSVRLRTNAARRYKRVENATAMIWKLLRVAENAWRHLKGSELLREVYDGQHFADGVRVVSKSKAAA